MAKRNVYFTGYYNNNRNDTLRLKYYSNQMIKNFRWIIDTITKFLRTSYALMSVNYLAVVTVLIVVVLSYIIPDLSQKIHATNDLKDMKKVLSMMSEQVNQAEVACCTAADEFCQLHCSMHDDATETAQALQDHSVCTSHCMHMTQSEPVQIEKKLGFFRRIFFPARNTSHKEFTIMSYLYTDSFDTTNRNDIDDTN